MNPCVKNWRLSIGIGIFSTLILVGILAPALSPYRPGAMDITQRLLQPSPQHWLGTDLLGIDVWTSLLYGARISLALSLSTVMIATTMGTAFGLTAGYFGKTLDQLLMRLTDVLMAFPGILLPLVLCTLLPPTYTTMVFTLCVTGWIGSARLVRAEVLTLREREYIQAAYSIGARPTSILFKHLLPNLIPTLMTQMTFSISSVILTEASLSFMGLGPKSSSPTWGQLLNQGRTVIGELPILAIAPGAAIFLVIIAVNMIADGLHK